MTISVHQKTDKDGNVLSELHGATYSHLGETTWRPTKKKTKKEALARAWEIAHEEGIEEQLTAKAIAKGKIPAVPVATNPTVAEPASPQAANGPCAKTYQEPANLKNSHPEGSFGYHFDKLIEARLKRLHGKRSKSTIDETIRLKDQVYEAFGCLLKEPIKEFGLEKGLILADYYNNGERFPKAGPDYAKHARKIFKPLLKLRLQEDFLEALKEVERQTQGKDKSDPFDPLHYQKMNRQLAFEADDYLEILFHIGCDGGPQLIDAVLLQRESVHFDSNEIILYRQKTKVIARFPMSPELRACLQKKIDVLPPNEPYVLYELIRLEHELKSGKYEPELVTDEKRLDSIGTTCFRLWREFLQRAGVPVTLSTFLERDIIDVTGIAAQLREKKHPIFTLIFDRMGDRAQRRVVNEPKTDEERRSLHHWLHSAFNRIIDSDILFDVGSLEGLTLRAETKELFGKQLKGDERLRAKRLVLEDVFEGKLAQMEKSPFYYTFSSFRRHLIAFMRSTGRRSEVVLQIIGQECLSSVEHYQSVPEHERQRAQVVNLRHKKAMIEGTPETVPATACDLYDLLQPPIDRLSQDMATKRDLEAMESRLLEHQKKSEARILEALSGDLRHLPGSSPSEAISFVDGRIQVLRQQMSHFPGDSSAGILIQVVQVSYTLPSQIKTFDDPSI